VREEGGEEVKEEGSAQGSMHWQGDDATAVDIEDPHRRRFGRS
jgi:hypothetical protein